MIGEIVRSRGLFSFNSESNFQLDLMFRSRCIFLFTGGKFKNRIIFLSVLIIVRIPNLELN